MAARVPECDLEMGSLPHREMPSIGGHPALEGRQVHIFSHFCLDGDEELVIRAIRRLGHEIIDVVCIAFETLSKAFEENHFPSFPFLFDNDLEDIEFR